jgi:hypothetical protein
MYLLYKIRIDNEDNVYTFTPDENSKLNGASSYSIKANNELLKRFLRRAGTADELTSPRSKRGMTYDAILKNIENGTDNNIYVFSHKYPKSLEDLQRIMQ